MFTPKRWDKLSLESRGKLRPHHTFIPSNHLGIAEGWYSNADVAKLLRKLATAPNNGNELTFIADMLE